MFLAHLRLESLPIYFARLVILHVCGTLEAIEPPNLFFVCVQTRTRVCACGVSVELCGLCTSKLYRSKNTSSTPHGRLMDLFAFINNGTMVDMEEIITDSF